MIFLYSSFFLPLPKKEKKKKNKDIKIKENSFNNSPNIPLYTKYIKI